jgi:hypothetical protein
MQAVVWCGIGGLTTYFNVEKNCSLLKIAILYSIYVVNLAGSLHIIIKSMVVYGIGKNDGDISGMFRILCKVPFEI